MKKLAGVYLVIDPKQDWVALLEKLASALKGGIRIVQVWDHWQEGISKDQKLDFICQVKRLASVYDVPVLMHEDWTIALEADLQGVHFDQIPDEFDTIKKALEGKHIGLTVGNDLQRIAWAEKEQLSYISFCAMFPTSSVDTCEIVNQETVMQAREITQRPIFLSGGIKPENMHRLKDLTFAGVAIISGILDADSPERATQLYINQLNERLSDSYEN